MSRVRAQAIEEARRLLKSDPVILDTETTGLGQNAQICEIAMLLADGALVLNTRVRPTIPISAEATGVHGITDADVPRGGLRRA